MAILVARREEALRVRSALPHMQKAQALCDVCGVDVDVVPLREVLRDVGVMFLQGVFTFFAETQEVGIHFCSPVPFVREGAVVLLVLRSHVCCDVEYRWSGDGVEVDG